MGVILRQGLKHSIVSLAATLLGLINTLFIYTYVLSAKELGFYRYLLSIAFLVFPFLLLGLDAVTVRFFSIFEQKSKKNNGFLFFLLSFPLIAFIIFFLVCLVFKGEIYDSYSGHKDELLLNQYLYLVPCLIVCLIFINILTRYVSNYKLIVVPEILNNLWLKIAVPAVAIFYYLGYTTFGQFLINLVLAYALNALFLIIYLFSLGVLDIRPNFKYFDKQLVKEIRNFSGYSLLGGMGQLLATRIDTYMVGLMIDMTNVGIYTIALFIATVVAIPLKSVFNITSPIVAVLMQENKLPEVATLYKKTSLNLLVTGLFLLVGIWGSIDLLFEIMPNGEDYIAGKYIVLILGLAKIIDMMTGINSQIIIYSKLYRFSFYITLLLAFLNIVFNLVFIPKFGVIGVALATFSSMFIYNLLKHIFVLVKFKMQPLTWSMIGVFLIGLVAYSVTLFVPKTGNPFIDIIINSIIITLIYIPSILYFNLSDDLEALRQKWVKKLFKR